MKSGNAIETLHACMAHAAYVAFEDYHYKDRDWAKRDAWCATPPDDCFVDKVRKHTDYDMTVYAMFSQTWSSTALGFGGIGDRALPSAYVCVIRSDLTGEFAVYFGGRLAYVIKHPNDKFVEDVARHRMVDAKLGKSTYEQEN